MTDQELYDALRSELTIRFQKTAMIIAKAFDASEIRKIAGDNDGLTMARLTQDDVGEFRNIDENRIDLALARLTQDSDIEAVGDIMRWRHSEIRLKS